MRPSSQPTRPNHVNVAVLAAAVILAFALQSYAFQSRFGMLLYGVGFLTSLSVLLRRGALGFASIVVVATAFVHLVAVYFDARPADGMSAFEAIRDAVLLTCIGLGSLFAVRTCFQIQHYLYTVSESTDGVDSVRSVQALCLEQLTQEFRTPLATMATITETLNDGIAGELSGQQQEIISDMDRTTRELLALVNDTHDYSLAEKGRLRLTPQPVALPELINVCVDKIRSRATRVDVSIAATVDPELTEVVADSSRLTQIVSNLLAGGIENCRRGGRVIMHLRPEGKNRFRINVRDTGLGSAAVNIEDQFDPFEQGENTETGLASRIRIALTRHLVVCHQGELECDCVAGAGTMVTVKLPMHLGSSGEDEEQDRLQNRCVGDPGEQLPGDQRTGNQGPGNQGTLDTNSHALAAISPDLMAQTMSDSIAARKE